MGSSSGMGGQGGYNPQIMPGQGGNNGGSFDNGAGGGLQNLGGTPFWQPWEGWNMKAGKYPTNEGNTAQGAAKMPGATDGLINQMGDFMNLPLYTNPNQYGRYNWGTNMQGGGVPSPFGQYAQQFAQYKPLQFPQPPQGGGGPGPGPGPSGPPSGPPGGGGPGHPPVDNMGRPTPFTLMNGNSSAMGRPDLNTGRIQDFGPFGGAGSDAAHWATNIYGNQFARQDMTPEQMQMSDQFTKDKLQALGPGFANPKLLARYAKK